MPEKGFVDLRFPCYEMDQPVRIPHATYVTLFMSIVEPDISTVMSRTPTTSPPVILLSHIIVSICLEQESVTESFLPYYTSPQYTAETDSKGAFRNPRPAGQSLRRRSERNSRAFKRALTCMMSPRAFHRSCVISTGRALETHISYISNASNFTDPRRRCDGCLFSLYAKFHLHGKL